MAVDQSEARKNFKSLLYKRGWTAKEVAAKIELSESTLYNWMKTTEPKNLGSGSLLRLADLLLHPERLGRWPGPFGFGYQAQGRGQALHPAVAQVLTHQP